MKILTQLAYGARQVAMYRMRRLIVVLSCAALALLLGLPLSLYALGLSGIEGRPQRPLQLASAEQKIAVWHLARGDGPPHVAADNPYSYAARVLFADEQRTLPGQLVTWWVARDYLVRHQRFKGTGWWHLSGATLAIWLSRNWTSDEVLSAAAQLRQSAEGRGMADVTRHPPFSRHCRQRTAPFTTGSSIAVSIPAAW